MKPYMMIFLLTANLALCSDEGHEMTFLTKEKSYILPQKNILYENIIKVGGYKGQPCGVFEGFLKETNFHENLAEKELSLEDIKKAVNDAYNHYKQILSNQTIHPPLKEATEYLMTEEEENVIKTITRISDIRISEAK